MQRALETSWVVVANVFTFNVTIKEKPPTRREMLSIESSVYDPIGRMAPFVSYKILVQELCRENRNWDDPISDQFLKRWNLWIKELPNIERLRVSRIIKPVSLKKISSAQFHVIVDVSECGFGAVSYLRFENEKKNIHCSFVMAKSRVPPLKK